MFCHTIRLVERSILIAFAILEAWSVWMIMSAVSIATSLPIPPIAISTSLAAKTGDHTLFSFNYSIPIIAQVI